MILIAAALAAASPASCPADATSPATLCRAVAAEQAGKFADAASGFESAAAMAEASDPAVDRMLAAAGGFPAYGNQHREWDAGARFDYPNPEHRA